MHDGPYSIEALEKAPGREARLLVV